MEIIIQDGCGLDVHQESITACVSKKYKTKQIKQFGTTTRELIKLKEWLHQSQIKHVAMESTGIYWKPVMNIIGEEFEVILVNARHMKNVPGKKTDVKDAEWICQLLKKGLLQKSFVPPQKINDLRNLTRYAKKLKQQQQQERNRIHKILQEANIKLTTVLSDIFGLAGMKILKDLSKGITDAKKLSIHFTTDFRLRHKQKQAIEALENRFNNNHQFMLKKQLDHMIYIQNQISDIETQIEKITKQDKETIDQLQTIPGVGNKAANSIVAEIGLQMDVFPTSGHLASWGGLCPGHNESAGKKKEQN